MAKRWIYPIPPLPAGLAAGYAVYHSAHLLVPGLDLGPVIGAVDLSQWRFDGLAPVGAVAGSGNYDAWVIILTGSLTLALVGTLDTAFSLRAARSMADISVDQNRDLIGQGIASIASALAGGIFVSTSTSLVGTAFQAGGRGRATTLTVGLVLLTGVALAPQVVFSIPLVVLAAILIVVGVNVIDKWAVGMLVQSLCGEPARRAQARRNVAVVLAVALATIFGKPIFGAAVGVALSCIVFMMEMNIPIVRRADTGERRRSKRIRSAAQHQVLIGHGREVAIFELQGVLFFGNADELASCMENLPDSTRQVVIDFRAVSDIDVSGAVALQHIATRLARHGKGLLISGLGEAQMLRAGVSLGSKLAAFADLDAALEHSEEEIIRRACRQETPELDIAATDFGITVGSEELEILKRHMRYVTFPKGTALCRADDAADRLWLLTRGSVSVWVETGAGRHRRIAGIGPGCTVGEMGLLNDLPRSADVLADEDVAAHELTRDALNAVMEATPRAGREVLASIARQLAERLRRSNEDLRLERF